MDWKDHPNAKEFSRGERISMGLANFGKERVKRQNMAQHDYEAEVGSMRAAKGGSTPKPTKREKLTWKDKRAADKILKAGKPKKGKT